MMTFEKAFEALEASRDAGKPVAVARAREAALRAALTAMAAELGVSLPITHIDANGEFRLVALAEDERERLHGACGQYGEAFARWLNTVPVRTGSVTTTGHVLPENGWCLIHHLTAEKLVRQYQEVRHVHA